MSNIDEALVNLISTITPVTALIGALPTMRFTPARIIINPQYPAVDYQRISAPRVYSHSGDSSFVKARYQLNIWSKIYLQSKQIELAFKTVLSGYKGIVLGVSISRIFVVDGPTGFEAETQTHLRTMDLMIDYQE